MNLLATLRFVEIHQEIYWLQKRTTETIHEIKLFDQQLIVKEQPIPLTTIFDISYRKKQEKDALGFLYIHSNQGVKAYLIKEEPHSFVQAYQKLKVERLGLH